MSLGRWLPWAVFSPFIFWLVLRFPIERYEWKFRVVLHVLACILVVVLGELASSQIWDPAMRQTRMERDFQKLFPLAEPDPLAGPPPMPGQLDDAPGDQSEDQPDGPLRDWHRDGPSHFGPPWWLRIELGIPIYLVIASLGHVLFYVRRSQQRDRLALELEAHLAQARLQALRMQLHPHFLFNTLNALSTLIHTAPYVADDMIGNLSTLLRLSLDSAAEQEITLGRELDFLDSYLNIEQVRFGPRLRVEKEITSEARLALVPTLILQPLVENAIRHGIEPQITPGVVKISARRADDWLCLVIADTGVGLPIAGESTGGPAEGAHAEGIGLSNTRARLQSLYPGRHRFALINAAGGGCEVRLEIPFHLTPFHTRSDAGPPTPPPK